MAEIIQADTKLIKKAEDLRVFQLAYDLSLQIHGASLTFPKIEQYDLTSQMRRASKSICANLVEGYEKQQFSKAEFKRFIAIALGSCSEMKLWVRYANDLKYLNETQTKELKDGYDSVSRMLQKLHSNI